MALRIPIVDLGGYLSELPVTDILNARVTDRGVVSLTNANASPITVGMAVYLTAAGDTVDKARANALGTVKVFGLVADASIAASATGAIQFDGPLSSADWTAVTGGTTLTPGAQYYLDAATAGKLTLTAPSAGNFVAPVGIAQSTTVMQININSFYGTV